MTEALAAGAGAKVLTLNVISSIAVGIVVVHVL